MTGEKDRKGVDGKRQHSQTLLRSILSYHLVIYLVLLPCKSSARHLEVPQVLLDRAAK